jgi:hypothetical protein
MSPRESSMHADYWRFRCRPPPPPPPHLMSMPYPGCRIPLPPRQASHMPWASFPFQHPCHMPQQYDPFHFRVGPRERPPTAASSNSEFIA